jgi:branched-chain amino acid transport system permease protein
MESIWISAVAGLAAGSAYAVIAVSLAFLYRLLSVVNFASAAVGAGGTFVMMAMVQNGVPLAGAAVCGIGAGAFLSAMVGLVITRWFIAANDSTKAAVTVAILVGLVSLGLRLSGGHQPQDFPALITGSAMRLGSVEITNATLLALTLAVGFALLTHVLLRHTRFGLQLSALAERPVAAQLLGLRVSEMSLVVWAVSGALSTAAVMVIAPQRAADFGTLSVLVVPAMAAALIGSLRSLWLAIVGGVGLGVLEGGVSGIGYFGQFRGVVPLFAILAILLWFNRGAHWDEAR